MSNQNRQKAFNELRSKYPFFEYESYSYREDKTGLYLTFRFNISQIHYFNPSLFIPAANLFHWENLDNSELDNLVFHLGMIELISYWKLTCSPEIRIFPHLLNSDQITWWKKLYFNGLGEFLYLNGVSIEKDALFDIFSEGSPLIPLKTLVDQKKVMVPIGGGKDSIVTLEVLKSSHIDVYPMAINMRPAIKRTIENAGIKKEKTLLVQRHLDPYLLELNQQKFLNGHTPFSALLAFTTVLLAAGTGIGRIALSNENSANESTVPGTHINHQYSKSFEFEQDFNAYCKKYLHPNIHYFSFLRPLNELQIAGLFATFPIHHPDFRSCNVGSKNDRWCGNCPKCLFTYLILAPFIPPLKLDKLLNNNLLENSNLITSFNELTGIVNIKPFECVGTVDEVNAAINKAFNNSDKSKLLLQNYPFSKLDTIQFDRLIKDWSTTHNLPKKLTSILKQNMHDRLT